MGLFRLFCFKGRVLATRITYLFIYNSRGSPTHALLLQLLIPGFPLGSPLRLRPGACFTSCFRRMSGRGVEQPPACGPAPTCALPRARWGLQRIFAVPHGYPGGTPRVPKRGRPRCRVCPCNQCVAGGFLLIGNIVQGNSEILFFLYMRF